MQGDASSAHHAGARRVRDEAARSPFEQGCAESLFESEQALAERWLADEEVVGGSGERLLVVQCFQ